MRAERRDGRAVGGHLPGAVGEVAQGPEQGPVPSSVRRFPGPSAAAGNVAASRAETEYTTAAITADRAAAELVALPRWRIPRPTPVPTPPPASPATVHTELASTSRPPTRPNGRAAEAAALCRRPMLTAASAARKNTGPVGPVTISEVAAAMTTTARTRLPSASTHVRRQRSSNGPVNGPITL